MTAPADYELFTAGGVVFVGETGEIVEVAAGADPLTDVTAAGLEAMAQIKAWERYLAGLKASVPRLLGPERTSETTRAGVAKRVTRHDRRASRDRIPEVAEAYELNEGQINALLLTARALDVKLIDQLADEGLIPADAADALVEEKAVVFTQFVALRKPAPLPLAVAEEVTG